MYWSHIQIVCTVRMYGSLMYGSFVQIFSTNDCKFKHMISYSENSVRDSLACKWIKHEFKHFTGWLFPIWFWGFCKQIWFLNFKNLVDNSHSLFSWTSFFGIKNTPEILNQAELGENNSWLVLLLGYIRIMFFRCSKTRSFQIILDINHENTSHVST